MVKIQIQNCLEEKIKKEGISKKDWEQAQKKADKGIEKLEQRRKKHELGFFDIQNDSELLNSINSFAKKSKGKFENIIVLGIGGSSLGVQALFSALLPANWNNREKKQRNNLPKMFFIDHMDSEYIDEIFSTLEAKKTLLVVISKSGSTIEPMSVLFAVLKNFPAENIVTITDPQKGLLRDLSDNFKFTSFPVPKNIGGRFSVLTAVGLLPMALMGLNIEKFLEGAKEAEKNWRNSKKNPARDLAIAQYLLDTKHQKNISVFFPYSKKLEKLAEWYIQLLAESIGKNEETGPTPIKAVGPTDQHAQVQLFMEGPNNKLHIFVEVEEIASKLKVPAHKMLGHLDYLANKTVHQILQAERMATTEAFTQMKKPNITISLEQLNEKTLADLIYTLQAQVALLGELYEVDAFNQPGVEIGKKLTKKYL